MANIRLALRMLVKTPIVTSVAMLSLALGIGANAAIFSLYSQFLLRPLPVAEPERLVNLEAPGPKPGSDFCKGAGGCDEVFSYPMFRDLQREQTVFTNVAAHGGFIFSVAYRGRSLNVVQGMQVSGSYFPALGLMPVLGRAGSFMCSTGMPNRHDPRFRWQPRLRSATAFRSSARRPRSRALSRRSSGCSGRGSERRSPRSREILSTPC